MEECQETSLKRSKRQFKSGSGGELLDELEHLGWSLRTLGCSGFELDSQEQWGDRKELYGGVWHGQPHAPGKGHSSCSVEEGTAASVRACFMTQPQGTKQEPVKGWQPGMGQGKKRRLVSRELYHRMRKPFTE